MPFSEPLVRFDPAQKLSAVHRRIFSDQTLFDLEVREIFEKGWVFLAHESQLKEVNDFLISRIGRFDVLVTRDANSELAAFYNTCPHRGAQLCNVRMGNKRVHVCQYHSWTFDPSGKNVSLKAKSDGAYPDEFLNGSQDLYRIERFENYRGFLFGSLDANAVPLTEYLGEAAKAIDLVVDQSPDGIELLPGCISYSYRANWKMQLENGSDGYHVTSTHPSYLHIAKKRAQAQGKGKNATAGVYDRAKTSLGEGSGEGQVASLAFENGHALLCAGSPITESHPLYGRLDELLERVGELKAKWMFATRNLTIFPSLQVAENFASILRVVRPVAPDVTEMVSYCIAPRGESREDREKRLRQYEDFFNPSGLATPDDLVAYEDCQRSSHLDGANGWLMGYQRGISQLETEPGPEARELGMKPVFNVSGNARLGDETIFQSFYRAWMQRLGPAFEETLNKADPS